MKRFKESVVKALLPHIILTQASSKRTVHGYGIIKHLRLAYGVYLGPSTVYPTILTLEKEGLIESRWVTPGPDSDHARKVYSLTEKGRRFLGQTAQELAIVSRTLVEVKA